LMARASVYCWIWRISVKSCSVLWIYSYYSWIKAGAWNCGESSFCDANVWVVLSLSVNVLDRTCSVNPHYNMRI
jgi:hypothetical protein